MSQINTLIMGVPEGAKREKRPQSLFAEISNRRRVSTGKWAFGD